MKKKLLLVSLGVAIPILLVLIFLLAYQYFVGFDIVQLSQNAQEIKINNALVMENDKGCFVDGICKIILENGQMFVYGTGDFSPNEYTDCQFPMEMQSVVAGDTLEIFGQLYPDGEIKLCDDKYYVRKVDGS